MNSYLSVFSTAALGSSLSVRGEALRTGGEISVCGATQFASSLSIRWHTAQRGRLSVFGETKCGYVVSVRSEVYMGSTELM